MSLTKPTLDNLRATGTTTGDVYFPQTELLLPFDGSNGATSTSDLSDNNHPITFAGNTQILTAQSKFGGSSCYFDGTGDYLTIPAHDDWGFGTGPYTIECWIKTSADSGWIINQANSDTGIRFCVGSNGYEISAIPSLSVFSDCKNT